jgi:hypothetical protein
MIASHCSFIAARTTFLVARDRSQHSISVRVESLAALSPIAQPGSVKPATLSESLLIPRLNRKKTLMFDPRALWTSLAQSSTSTSMTGWVITGLAIVFALRRLMDRPVQPIGSAAHILEAAARLNASRAAPPASTMHQPANSRDSGW